MTMFYLPLTGGRLRQIDVLKHFADNFSVTVNMSKTKIIALRKAGFLAASEVWRYGDEEIQVVNSHKYLALYHQTVFDTSCWRFGC